MNIYFYIGSLAIIAGIIATIYYHGFQACQEKVNLATANAQAAQLASDLKKQTTIQQEADTLDAMDDEDLHDSIAWKKKYETLSKQHPNPIDCKPNADIVRLINSAGEGKAVNNRSKSVSHTSATK